MFRCFKTFIKIMRAAKVKWTCKKNFKFKFICKIEIEKTQVVLLAHDKQCQNDCLPILLIDVLSKFEIKNFKCTYLCVQYDVFMTFCMLMRMLEPMGTKIHSQIVYLLKILPTYSLIFLLGYLPQLFVQLFGFIR